MFSQPAIPLPAAVTGLRKGLSKVALFFEYIVRTVGQLSSARPPVFFFGRNYL